MNRLFLIGIFVLGCVCFTAGNSYACPTADIETDPQECAGQAALDDEACVGQWIHFDGSGSSDDGSIEYYEWTFPAAANDINEAGSSDCNSCGSNCLDGNDCEEVKCHFDEPGSYTITLSVQDDEGNWDVDTATVYIVAVNDVTVPVDNVCPDTNVIFTVVTDGPSGHYEPIVWQTSPAGSPASQQGEQTFTTKWSSGGGQDSNGQVLRQ